MRTNERSRRSWSALVLALGSLALTTETALAGVPSSTAYHFSSHPMISGTVVTVNDRQLVVDTGRGERVTLEMDSRTMAPRGLAPGMVMRAEFLAMEDCRFYAQSITPTREGMSTDGLPRFANTDRREGIVHDASALATSLQEDSENVEDAQNENSLRQMMGERPQKASTRATPATTDHQLSTHPMIAGKVISANDHRLMIETDQGQRIGLVMDSHTLVPREVASGTPVRAEFTQMKDGRYYAKRVSRIRSGTTGCEPAYAHTRESEIATDASDCGFVSAVGTNEGD